MYPVVRRRRTRPNTAAQRDPALGPSRTVFSQDGSDRKLAPKGYLRAAPRVALPIAMVRSGPTWPLDDALSRRRHPALTARNAHCRLCVPAARERSISRNGRGCTYVTCVAPLHTIRACRALAQFGFRHDLSMLYGCMPFSDNSDLSLAAPTLGDGRPGVLA